MNTLTADFADVAELASHIESNPDIAQVLAQRNPKGLEKVMRVAKFPLLRWRPFGSLVFPYSHQVAALRSPARERWMVTGNRCGKTETGMMEDVADCLGIDIITKKPSTRFKPPVEIWVVSDTEDTSIQIVQRKVADEILGRDQTDFGWSLVDDSVTYNPNAGFNHHSLLFTNKSRIDFKFSSQGVKTFGGTKKHKIHIDEEQPKDIYEECYARTIDHEGQILGTMTPVIKRGVSWVFQELYVQRKAKGIEFFNWSIFDNPYISDTAKEDLLRRWPEDEREVRAYGMFTPIGMRLAFPRRLLTALRIQVQAYAAGRVEWHQDHPIFKEAVNG